MSLSAGARIGPYEVLGSLGAGAMGEVYKARDVRLGREVALKVLPETLARDADRLSRLRREAQLLASLNHPHIAAIYGLEEANGRLALALEFVNGEGLDARLARAPIAIDEALSIARQIADALEAAHDRGIIHRDLKPGNVKLTPDGHVKLLDFGLAKAHGDNGAGLDDTDPSSSPTFTRHATEAGMILGTAAYMAPEQARGKPVDKRADIWAFGVVLYELLAGTRPFTGDTVSDTLAAVLTREPDWSGLRSDTPPGIRDLLRRCLERDPKERLRDIGEARIVLSRSYAVPTDVAGNTAARGASLPGPRALFLAVAAVFGLTLVWLAWPPASRSIPDAAPSLVLGIDAGGATPLAGVGWIGMNWVGPTTVVSPDGRLLAFIARGRSGGPWQLYTRRLDELDAAPLAGTEGAYAPFFSPDGRWIAFFSAGRLMKVALEGGAVTAVCPAEEARGGTWGEDGVILFAPRPEGPLFRVPADGGTPAPATALDSAAGETTHRWPQLLPGGRTVLFTAHADSTSDRGTSVVVESMNDGSRTVVHRGGLYARYVASGHLIYVYEGSLFAIPFDVEQRKVTGRPVPVVEDVAHAVTNGGAQVAFSDTGLLAYRRRSTKARLLGWMDFAGQIRPMRNVPAEYSQAKFSPDHTRLLLTIDEGAQSDIWVYDIERDTLSRLTFHSDNDWSPVWTPDGSRFAYISWRADVGTFNLFWHRTDGSGEPERLLHTTNRQLPEAWDPSGRFLLYTEFRADTGLDVMLLPLAAAEPGPAKPGTPKPVLNTRFNETSARISPDGKWLAYTSDESGRAEVYVQPFPGPGGRWQVSTEGAEWVEWRRNSELYYGRSEEVVMTVSYRVAGNTFIAGNPRVWMPIPQGVLWLDPHADGTRAAVIRAEDPRRESLVLITNFFEYLRRLGTP